MKVIRNQVFETNSSSTHSISIYKWTPTEEKEILLNTELVIDGQIPGQTEIKDEMGKLNYIIVLLASIADSRCSEYYGSDNRSKHFNELINSNHFIWLKEIIKEKCNTNIIYHSNNNYYPYFETTYDEHKSIEEVLGFDVDNETEFKSNLTEIIFNKNYIIEDKENEY